jgi:hypothetical protein
MQLNSVRGQDDTRIIVWSESPRTARLYLLLNSVRGPVDPTSIVWAKGLSQKRRTSDLPTTIFDTQTLDVNRTLDLSRRADLVVRDLLIHTVGRNLLGG